MAAARPASPVSALRPGRTTPNSVKRRSSRANRGSKPARRNDDLPVPDGPNTTNSDFVSAGLMPRSSSSPCTIGASRPKNTAASTCSNGSHPRYGARSTSSGGGHTNECALMPVPRIASRNRYNPPVANITGGPPPTSIEVMSLSPNRSHRCHSEVKSSPADGSRRAHKICLFRFSATRYSVLHSWDASQLRESRQTTASHFALACCSLSFHRSPGRRPTSGSMSRKMSVASGGS